MCDGMIQMSMISRKYLFAPFLLSMFLVMIISPAGAAFNVPPTFDLTTTTNVAGATSAGYVFHFENPSSDVAVAFSVVVPAGYFVNPTYMTTTPGIVVMFGYYDNVGDYSAPYDGTVEIKTTAVSGVFEIFVDSISMGVAALTVPTPTTPGSFGGLLPGLNNGYWGEVATLQGFLINPSTPGLYTWGPNTATPSSGPTVTMNPRVGESNQVNIVGTYVSFDKPYLYVDVGSTFTVSVSIKNLPSAMNQFDLTVDWNPGQVELAGIVEVGEVESRPWDTYYTNPPWSGSVTCYGEGQGWSTDAVWFTLTFRCLGPGTSTISVSSEETIILVTGGSINSEAFAIYCNQREPLRGPVGGIVMPVDKLEMMEPYIALAGLVAVSAVVAVKRRRD